MVEGVEGVAIGHDHLLLLRSSGWIDHVGPGSGDGSSGSGSSGGGSSGGSDNIPSKSNSQQSTFETSTTTTMPSFVRPFSTAAGRCPPVKSNPNPSPLNQASPCPLNQPSPCPLDQVLRVSAGVRHSATVTTDGWSHTLSTRPINTPYRHTLSTHPINTQPYTLSTNLMNTPYEPILSTRPIKNITYLLSPFNTPSTTPSFKPPN